MYFLLLSYHLPLAAGKYYIMPIRKENTVNLKMFGNSASSKRLNCVTVSMPVIFSTEMFSMSTMLEKDKSDKSTLYFSIDSHYISNIES